MPRETKGMVSIGGLVADLPRMTKGMVPFGGVSHPVYLEGLRDNDCWLTSAPVYLELSKGQCSLGGVVTHFPLIKTQRDSAI